MDRPASARELVLVIDDDDDVRRVLVRMLNMAGFDTLEARDGSEAVHVFGDRAADIAACTLDWEMPTTNGRETLAMLSAFAPRLPIVIATAYPRPDTSLGRDPGAPSVGYLQKPFTPDELSRELRRVIDELRPRS